MGSRRLSSGRPRGVGFRPGGKLRSKAKPDEGQATSYDVNPGFYPKAPSPWHASVANLGLTASRHPVVHRLASAAANVQAIIWLTIPAKALKKLVAVFPLGKVCPQSPGRMRRETWPPGA